MKRFLVLILCVWSLISIAANDLWSLGSDGNTYYFEELPGGEAKLVRAPEPHSYSGAIEIPAKVYAKNADYDVVAIGESVFFGCMDLKSVVLPPSLRKIERNAFGWCSGIEVIELGKNIEEVSLYAFQGCSSLVEIVVDKGNPWLSVEDGLLMCGDRVVLCPGGYSGQSYLSSKAQEIGGGAFYECTHLSNVHIPLSVTAIDSCAFYYCYGLKAVTIPESVERIEAGAFGECAQLTSFSVSPGNSKYVADGASIISKADSVIVQYAPAYGEQYEMPEWIRGVGAEAFFRCYDLQSVSFPEGLRTIGKAAFADCWSLQTVTFPSTLHEVGFGAFAFCEELSAVYLSNVDPESVKVDEDAFFNVPSTCVLCVPAGSIDRYRGSAQWEHFQVIREYESQLSQTIIWDQPLDSCHADESVELEAVSTSGLSVSFSIVENNEIAELEGNTLSFKAPGIVSVKAYQGGDSRYLPAPSVTRQISVGASGLKDAQADKIEVLGTDGVIIIKGAVATECVRVYGIDGSEAYCGRSRAILIRPGIYIVSVGGTTAKVAVK